MTEFFLDVSAVVVGVAVYSWLRKRIERWRRRWEPSWDPWDNW